MFYSHQQRVSLQNPSPSTNNPNKNSSLGLLCLSSTTCDLVVWPQVCCVISNFCCNKPLFFQIFLTVIAVEHFVIIIWNTRAGLKTILVVERLKPSQNTLTHTFLRNTNIGLNIKAAVPKVFGARNQGSSENLKPDDLRWSWRDDASAGEELQIQIKLCSLVSC